MSKDVISEDSARAQLDLFLDFYEISLEDIKNTEAKMGMENTIEKIAKTIRKGRLEITEEGDNLKVVQTLKRPPGETKTIEYSIVAGRHKITMKDKGKDDHYGRLYAMMGGISGLGEKAIVSLDGVDMSLVECLGALYLNV